MDINKISFVYYKNGRIKVLRHDEARRENDKLLSKGWVHTKTMDVNLWIENIYNNLDRDSRLNEIYNLSRID